MNIDRRGRGRFVQILLLAVLMAASTAMTTAAAAKAVGPALHYSVSMDRPNLHYFHVVLRCEGLSGSASEFRMPAWTPGYYSIMNYAGCVINFQAADGLGKPLAWRKTDKSAWRITTGGAMTVTIEYDVYGFTHFIASNYLASDSAFIAPAGMFMYPAGWLKDQVTVEIKPAEGWTGVETGLEPIPGMKNVFAAPDFDTLYDCPILIGKLEKFDFQVKGLNYRVAAPDMTGIDKAKYAADLAKIVDAATSVVGETPYKHYTFLMIGPGGGGLEHLNSCALTYSPARFMDPAGYKGWLPFVTHEFFHCYNVKSIRPIALGPFDYDRENCTNMLWVSEGLTVYYEYIILNRAGLAGRDEALEELGGLINEYENSPGRRVQPATASSFDTWLNAYGQSGEHAANTTVSYYVSGPVLGLLLDLDIRHASKGKACLDDVMRSLYHEFYQAKKRGFTDEEFRATCERVAGTRLDEVFSYAEKIQDFDYAKYLGYAGLELAAETSPEPPKGWLGAVTGGGFGMMRRMAGPGAGDGGAVTVSRIEWNSPAAAAGLSCGDEIVAVDGTKVTSRSYGEIMGAKKPGDKVRIVYSRDDKLGEVEVTLGVKPAVRYRIKPAAGATAEQKALLAAWLK